MSAHRTPPLKAHKYQRYRQDEFRWRGIAIRSLFCVQQALILYYLVWLIRHANTANWPMFMLFYVAEILCFMSATLTIFIIWRRRFTRAHCEMRFQTPPSVDIFITVCGEPADIVHATVKAAAHIDYPNKTVHVLDDGASPEVRAVARALGCDYLSRPVKTDSKAGNLNHGLRHSSGQFVLTLDADQAPAPDILKNLIGYFALEHIAFIQTAQDFYVSKDDPFGNKESLFYNIEQTGKDASNAAFACGSGVIYRRKALEDVGGFSTWNLVEDLHTSLLLHAKGWRSIYVDKAYSKGYAPEDIWSFYRQRRQWCTDSVRMLLWDSPLLKSRLTLSQRLQYFTTGVQYIVTAFVIPIFYLLPAWSLLTGQFFVQDTRYEYLPLRFSLLFLTHVINTLVYYPHAYQKSMRVWCGQFPNFIVGVIVGVFSWKSKPEYKITPKVRPKPHHTFLAILPQLAIIALNLAAIVYGAVHQTCSRYVFAINVFWILWICWLLSQICYASLWAHRLTADHDVQLMTAGASTATGQGAGVSTATGSTAHAEGGQSLFVAGGFSLCVSHGLCER